jgi:hypothetical protein
MEARFQDGGVIFLMKDDADFVRTVNDRRTTGQATFVPRKVSPAQQDRAGKDWSSDQCSRKRLCQNWQQFFDRLAPERMVHVVTDGGADPNPSHTGWSALIKKNEVFTWMSEHYVEAPSDTMELQAAVEALRILPHGMWVWVSTDWN